MSVHVAKLPIAAKLPIVADLHMHTIHSHGTASVQQMYEASLAKGLQYIGFSEHSPRPEGYRYASDYQDKLREVFPCCVKAVQKMQAGTPQGITVLLGLELDYIKGQEPYMEALAQEYPYDYIIGGLHFQGTWGFDGPVDEWADFSHEKCFAVYRQYYEDLCTLCETGLFHIVAHPDLVKMHNKPAFDTWLETSEALPAIKNFMSSVKDAGMVMEVSSAGLRKKCAEIYPGPQVMHLAAEMKVPISFGSDAHCTNTPAYGFAELARYAAHFGYTQHTIFKQKKAIRLPFDIPLAR